jgi:hypothetical protein
LQARAAARDARGAARTARILELQAAEQALPGAQVVLAAGRLDPRPERLGSSDVSTAWRSQRSSRSRSRTTPGASTPAAAGRVVLGRLAHVAGAEQALDAPDVGLHVAGEPVALGVDPRAEQLAQPADLDAHAAGAAAVAVQVGAQALGAVARRVGAQEREDLREPRAQLGLAAAELQARALVTQQVSLKRGRVDALRRCSTACTTNTSSAGPAGSAIACTPEGSMSDPPPGGTARREAWPGGTHPAGSAVIGRPDGATSAREMRPDGSGRTRSA